MSLLVPFLGWIGAWLLRWQCATWSTTQEGLDRLDERITRGDRTLLTCWHGKYLPLFALLRGRRACIVTSQSFRGEVIAEICRSFGYDCVAIPDRANVGALRRLRQTLARHRLGAFAVDGPLGPYHVVKHLPIELASRLGCALLPISVASRRKWVMKQRWDHMEVPWPFTQVYLLIGTAMEVPPRLTREAVTLWAQCLHDTLETIGQRAAERVRVSSAHNPGAKLSRS